MVRWWHRNINFVQWSFMKTLQLNLLRPRSAIWCHNNCCLTIPGIFLNKYWPIISEILLHSPGFEGCHSKIAVASSRGQWVIHYCQSTSPSEIYCTLYIHVNTLRPKMMATIFLATFSWMKTIRFWYEFRYGPFLPWSNPQYVSIVSNNG